MNTKLYLLPHLPFDEYNQKVTENYDEHAKKFDLVGAEKDRYYYPYALGAFQESYKALYSDFMQLKAEYDKEKEAIESSHLNLVQ